MMDNDAEADIDIDEIYKRSSDRPPSNPSKIPTLRMKKMKGCAGGKKSFTGVYAECARVGDELFACEPQQTEQVIEKTINECAFFRSIPEDFKVPRVPTSDVHYKLVLEPKINNMLPPLEEQIAKKESIMQKFDRDVSTELLRRRDSEGAILDPETNDVELLAAVDQLSRAEALHTFGGAVRAAEEAAKIAPPEKVEEAAVEGARGFQAEIVDVISQQVSCIKPIQVMGYIGITRPTEAVKFRYV